VYIHKKITVSCSILTDPVNGNVTCPSTTSVFQDTCAYYCNRGYQLNGNSQPSCTADRTWSSEPVTCTILTCNDPEDEIANSQSVGDCSMTYGSRCLLNCSSGYIARGNGVHVCDDVNDEGTSVKWRSVGEDFSCVNSGEYVWFSNSIIISSISFIFWRFCWGCYWWSSRRSLGICFFCYIGAVNNVLCKTIT